MFNVLSAFIVGLQLDPGDDVHGGEFLKEKLASVRDLYFRYVPGGLAELTPAVVSDQSAVPAYVHLCVCVGKKRRDEKSWIVG